MDPTLLSQYILSGVVIGVIYGLMALGITFIYSIMKMINWSMGEFYMIGSYVQYALLAGVLGWSLWYVALPVAMVSVFLLGLLVQRFLLRPMYVGGVERRGGRASRPGFPRLSRERRHLDLQGLRDHRHRRARIHPGEYRGRDLAGRDRGARIGLPLACVQGPLRLRAPDRPAGLQAHGPLRGARANRIATSRSVRGGTGGQKRGQRGYGEIGRASWRGRR